MPPSQRDQEPDAEMAKLHATFHLRVPTAQCDPAASAALPALRAAVRPAVPRALRDHSPSALQEAQPEAEHRAELPALRDRPPREKACGQEPPTVRTPVPRAGQTQVPTVWDQVLVLVQE